jgi:hypothetical protein
MAGIDTYSCEDFMIRLSLVVWLLSAASLSSLASPATWAQTNASKPDPADAGISVPSVIYDSSFARYRAFAEQEVAPWKDSNDTAGRIGGWRVYAREAREPEAGGKARPPGVQPVPVEAAKPMPDSYGGHQMNHGRRRE